MAASDATFYTYVNTGLAPLTADRVATVATYVNAGLEGLTAVSDATAATFINTGVALPVQTIIDKKPRGWGTATGPTLSFGVQIESSAAIFYTYINTV